MSVAASAALIMRSGQCPLGIRDRKVPYIVGIAAMGSLRAASDHGARACRRWLVRWCAATEMFDLVTTTVSFLSFHPNALLERLGLIHKQCFPRASLCRCCVVLKATSSPDGGGPRAGLFAV